MSTPLARQLSHVVDLRVPGYLQVVPAGTIGQKTFAARDSAAWYQAFVDRIAAAVGTRHLPVYRMADGEFEFCVGERAGKPFTLKPRDVARSLIQHTRVLMKRRRTDDPGIATCWGETYTAAERADVMRRYVASLQSICRDGLIALHFTATKVQFGEAYFRPMCEWFDEHAVPLGPDNYLPFYFVYALLCGPDVARLVEGRRVLIVTSVDDDKRARLTAGLDARGAASVSFLPISSSRAMFDQPDPTPYLGEVDVALVGAGIASSLIIEHLRPLAVPCIDAGLALEIFADDARRDRIFTVPDAA